MIFDNESISNSVTATPNYSSLTRRFVAFLIDGFILSCIGVCAGMIVPALGAVVAWFFYAPILESSEWRATIGKHLMGIQVGDLMGRRISLRTALLRNVMKIVSCAFVMIGFLIALFSDKKQALHDHLADTIVVYGRSEARIADVWMTSVKTFISALST